MQKHFTTFPGWASAPPPLPNAHGFGHPCLVLSTNVIILLACLPTVYTAEENVFYEWDTREECRMLCGGEEKEWLKRSVKKEDTT